MVVIPEGHASLECIATEQKSTAFSVIIYLCLHKPSVQVVAVYQITVFVQPLTHQGLALPRPIRERDEFAVHICITRKMGVVFMTHVCDTRPWRVTLSPRGALMCEWCWSTPLQIMPWCLMAPNHELNQCSFIANKISQYINLNAFFHRNILHIDHKMYSHVYNF